MNKLLCLIHALQKNAVFSIPEQFIVQHSRLDCNTFKGKNSQ